MLYILGNFRHGQENGRKESLIIVFGDDNTHYGPENRIFSLSAPLRQYSSQ
jgi:hypothetical protein